ncbi:hypothetical protein GH854_34460, partial [Bacillus thuringiensis]|nr:hypothetical protein [Bacillus thuringiensis]
MWTRLLPFLAWLPGLHRGMLGREAWVGLNGAILALPQSMAYALIAGLPAEYGLYAAMLPVASPPSRLVTPCSQASST